MTDNVPRISDHFGFFLPTSRTNLVTRSLRLTAAPTSRMVELVSLVELAEKETAIGEKDQG